MDEVEKIKDLLRQLIVFQADVSDSEKRLYDMSRKALELQNVLVEKLDEGV